MTFAQATPRTRPDKLCYCRAKWIQFGHSDMLRLWLGTELMDMLGVMPLRAGEKVRGPGSYINVEMGLGSDLGALRIHTDPNGPNLHSFVLGRGGMVTLPQGPLWPGRLAAASNELQVVKVHPPLTRWGRAVLTLCEGLVSEEPHKYKPMRGTPA